VYAERGGSVSAVSNGCDPSRISPTGLATVTCHATGKGGAGTASRTGGAAHGQAALDLSATGKLRLVWRLWRDPRVRDVTRIPMIAGLIYMLVPVHLLP
jgi:hypothetical protein